jgi:hypothetical protein
VRGRQHLPKAYGVKKRWYWERVEKYSKEHGEQIGNVMRTHWEPDENTLRMRENEKKLPPTPYPNPKGIQSGHLEPTLPTLNPCNFSFPNCSSPFLA